MRSSCSQVGVLQNFTKSMWKHFCCSHFLTLQISRPETSLKRDSGTSKFYPLITLCLFFHSFFSFIIDNCNYGSLLRKCLKMKIFLLFTIVYSKININVVKTILPWQWLANTHWRKYRFPLAKAMAFTESQGKFWRLILKLGIKNWVLKVISYYYIVWQIHQLFIYIYLINFSFLKCFKTLSGTSRKDLFWNLSEWKKVPQPAACPIRKMSSWQPNNNDKLLCTRYWAIPEIIYRVGIYGAQGHGKIILN